MLEAHGKLINRPTQTGGKTYDKYFIYVPIEVARDSAFPFKANEKVKVKIDTKNNQVIIEKTI
jgi:ABC-type lipoprotein release transport system permease subunit